MPRTVEPIVCFVLTTAHHRYPGRRDVAPESPHPSRPEETVALPDAASPRTRRLALALDTGYTSDPRPVSSTEQADAIFFVKTKTTRSACSLRP